MRKNKLLLLLALLMMAVTGAWAQAASDLTLDPVETFLTRRQPQHRQDRRNQ